MVTNTLKAKMAALKWFYLPSEKGSPSGSKSFPFKEERLSEGTCFEKKQQTNSESQNATKWH